MVAQRVCHVRWCGTGSLLATGGSEKPIICLNFIFFCSWKSKKDPVKNFHKPFFFFSKQGTIF